MFFYVINLYWKLRTTYETGRVFPACQDSALLKKQNYYFELKKKKTHIFDSRKQGKSSFIFVVKLLAHLASQLFHEIVIVWNVGICLMMKQMIVVLLTIRMEELLLLRKSLIEHWIRWRVWNSRSSVEGDRYVVWSLYCRWNKRRNLLKIVLISPWIHIRHLLICCCFVNLFVLFWREVIGGELNRILAGGIRAKQWIHCFVFFLQIFWSDPLISSMRFHALVPWWLQFRLFWNRQIWKHGNVKRAFTMRHVQMSIFEFANLCKIFAHIVNIVFFPMLSPGLDLYRTLLCLYSCLIKN